MRSSSTNKHFSNFELGPERERRLAYFADQKTPEELEKERQQREKAKQKQLTVQEALIKEREKLNSRLLDNVEKIEGAEVIDYALRTPAILQTVYLDAEFYLTLDERSEIRELITEEEIERLKVLVPDQFKDVVARMKESAPVTGKGTDYLARKDDAAALSLFTFHNEDARSVAKEALVRALTSPEKTMRLANGLEERLRKYEDIERLLANDSGLQTTAKTLEEIQALEERLRLRSQLPQEGETEEGTIQNISDFLAESDPEDIMQQLGIEFNPTTAEVSDDPEVQRIARKLAVEYNFHAPEKPTREDLVTSIFNKISASNALVSLQQSDRLGITTPEELREETIPLLKKQVAMLNRHLDLQLQKRAKWVSEKLHIRISELPTDVTQFEETYGISYAAMLNRIAQTSGTVTRVLRLQWRDELAGLKRSRAGTHDEEIKRLEELLAATDAEEELAPEPDDPFYLTYARGALEQIEELESTVEDHKAFETAMFTDLRMQHADAREFVDAHQDGLEELALQTGPDATGASRELLTSLFGNEADDYHEAVKGISTIQQRVKDGTATPQEIFVHNQFIYEHTAPDRKISTTALIATSNPTVAKVTLKKMEQKEDFLENDKRSASEVIKQLDNAVAVVLSHNKLQHPVIDALEIPIQIKLKYDAYRGQLEFIDQEAENESHNKFQEQLASIKVEVAALEECATRLSEVQIKEVSSEEFKMIVGSDAFGSYERGDNIIYINRDRIRNPDHRKQVADHEWGHAILDVLTRDTGVLHPQLFSEAFAELSEGKTATVGGHEISHQELLEYLAVEKWGYNREAVLARFTEEAKANGATEEDAIRIAHERWQDLITDEYFVKYADHKTGTRRNAPAEALALFSLMDEATGEPEPTPLQLAKRSFHDVDDSVHSLQTEEFGEAPPSESGISVEDEVDVTDYNEDIRFIDRTIGNAKSFLGTELANKYTIVDEDTGAKYKLGDKIREYISIMEPRRNAMVAAFKRGESITEESDNLKTAAGGIDGLLDAAKESSWDLTREEATGKTSFRAFYYNMNMMSLRDFVHIIKQGWEDLNRIWKRREESIEARAGQALTGWIPDNVPYIGQLKHEFKRRHHQSELEEVNQWKEALKEVDAWELVELLGKSRIQDQVRAIIELLSERGRLDWNDVDFWGTLNALSNYSMPIAACKNDDVLRDRWLQKLITNIWDDKDKYYNWRQSNDSGVQSGKQKFTSTVDQLANTNDGLDKEIYRQLKLYVEAKRAGRTPPEDVNPHLFEEILHYAIRMGKMTMEGKFFYLIQGIRYGLMSIDRLRTLAGAEGEILLIFPFIDYFYQKNNQMADMERLGRYLQESDPYLPGPKTTLFCQLVINREQSVKERLRKGASRVAEKMDHDDMHYFLSNLDYSNIEYMLDTFSGNRQKLTTEGLKNGYVGFNEKLRAYAVLAHWHLEGKANFTNADALDVAQTIIGSIHFDNILTRNGVDKPTRPKLSQHEIAHHRPVVGKNRKVVDFRKSLLTFAQASLAHYITDEDWAQVNREIQSGENAVNLQNYTNRNPYENPGVSEELPAKVFAATARLVDIFDKAVLRDPQAIIRFLAEYYDDFVVGGGQYSHDEGLRIGVPTGLIRD